MALTIKNLAASVVTTATQTLYTAPTSPVRSALVKNIMLTNIHTAAITLDLRIKSGGSSYHIAPPTLNVPPSATIVIDQEVTLGSGDLIEVANVSNTASKIEYVLNGLERDV